MMDDSPEHRQNDTKRQVIDEEVRVWFKQVSFRCCYMDEYAELPLSGYFVYHTWCVRVVTEPWPAAPGSSGLGLVALLAQKFTVRANVHDAWDSFTAGISRVQSRNRVRLGAASPRLWCTD